MFRRPIDLVCRSVEYGCLVTAPITDYALEAAVALIAGTLVPPTAQIGSVLDATGLTPPKAPTHPTSASTFSPALTIDTPPRLLNHQDIR